MTTGGRDGIGGGGVFLAGFFLSLTPSTEGCLVPSCLGRVFERGLVINSSEAADDLESNAVSSSTLTLLYRLLDPVDCRVPGMNRNKN